MDRTTVLIIDDDKEITEGLAAFLERSGFSCIVAENGKQGIEVMQCETPDLILCDVIMPEMDGREFLRDLRMKKKQIPLIMLTRIETSSEKIMSLEEGADDYINKPFEPMELIARIKAVLRRSQIYKKSLGAAWILAAEKLVFDRQRREVCLEGEPIHLTHRAFCLLEYLIIHPDEILSRERLQEAVWGWKSTVDSRAVDTRIGELRRILKDDPNQPTYIETIPQYGYRFIPTVKIISS